MKFNFGQIILAEIQYTDTFEIKTRPVLVLFEELGNIVVAGITSNLKMKGILITKREGLPKDSIIKLNYIFTISEKMVKKYLINISEEKKKIIKSELIKKIN
jgi:mRNA interferase MazF